MTCSVYFTEEAKQDLRGISNYAKFNLKAPFSGADEFVCDKQVSVITKFKPEAPAAAKRLLNDIQEQVMGFGQIPERFPLYELDRAFL